MKAEKPHKIIKIFGMIAFVFMCIAVICTAILISAIMISILMEGL